MCVLGGPGDGQGLKGDFTRRTKTGRGFCDLYGVS